MNDLIIDGQKYQSFDVASNPLPLADYEACEFHFVNFNINTLLNFKFTECKFYSCQWNNIILDHVSIVNCEFIDCKLQGLNFHACNPFLFEASFNQCKLNHSSFYNMNLKQFVFSNCDLIHVDFTNTNLQKSKIEHCNLLDATFENTNLEQVDLSTSYNFSIDPDNNKIKKATFSSNNVIGLLNKYDIKIVS